MKYITDWDKTDEEISIILQKNEKYNDGLGCVYKTVYCIELI